MQRTAWHPVVFASFPLAHSDAFTILAELADGTSHGLVETEDLTPTRCPCIDRDIEGQRHEDDRETKREIRP